MARLENKKDIFEELNKTIETLEEEESAVEKVLSSILTKGLSIVDKVLGKIDEKLDDPEFMKKIEDKIVVEIDKAEVDTTVIGFNNTPDFTIKPPEVERDE